VQVPGIREITGIPKVVKAFMKVLVGRILSSREKENTDPKKTACAKPGGEREFLPSFTN
jgi:hypothetical protein